MATAAAKRCTSKHWDTARSISRLLPPIAVPCDWRPADGGGALEFIIQACLPEGASLPDTALSESWEWLAEPIC